MEPKRITFIVGAGASSEFGLPTGKQLLELISGMVRQKVSDSMSRVELDQDLIDALKVISNPGEPCSNETPEYLNNRSEAAWLCSVALMAPSIDNLIHSHRSRSNIESIGKVLIAKSIREAESHSFLANIKNFHSPIQHFGLSKSTTGGPEYISDKWIGILFILLVEMRDFSEFLQALDRLHFLCFNYDRCIEQALTSMAIRYYQLEDKDGQLVLDRLNVTHIYGSLGKLRVDQGLVHGFGSKSEGLVDQSAEIHTFTNARPNDQVPQKIKEVMTNSKFAVFLGYGFLSINNRLFVPSRMIT
jgi:hypothetical protein